MKRLPVRLMLLACGLACAMSASSLHSLAQTATSSSILPPARAAASTLSTTKEFVDEVTIAGLAEVQLGQMAAQRASNADVKSFGQMMVTDHTKASDELQSIAVQLNVSQPTQLDQKHKELFDKLSKLEGSAFDREYMAAMVQGHQDVLAKLRAHTGESHGGLANWVKETIPTVEDHLERAKAIQTRLTN